MNEARKSPAGQTIPGALAKLPKATPKASEIQAIRFSADTIAEVRESFPQYEFDF